MDEELFWTALEFRICQECSEQSNKKFQNLWCDGLVPERYELQGPNPYIQGQAYFGESGQEQWEFKLILPTLYKSKDEINWQLLVPAELQTNWLSIGLQSKKLEMDLSSCYSKP